MELEILQNIYNKKFHQALNRIEQNVPPIWMMRQAGRYHKHYQNLKQRYSFEELCRQPELACEVTLGPIEDFDFDAAIRISDIIVPLDFLGKGLEWQQHRLMRVLHQLYLHPFAQNAMLMQPPLLHQVTFSCNVGLTKSIILY